MSGMSGRTQLDDAEVRPRPVKRSQAPSAWKCCAVILVILLALGVCAAVYACYLWFAMVWINPHADLHRPLGGEGTVEALIKADTRLDVGLVVYARKPNDQASHPEQYADDWDAGVENETLLPLAMEAGIPLVELLHLPEEDVVFSDIVLRNFSLQDKNTDAQVSFNLPLERFYDYRLWENDVRVAIVFTPTSGVLDQIIRVHSRLGPNPVRFPSVDENLEATGQFGKVGSVSRRAVEQLSINIPLVHIDIDHDGSAPPPLGPSSQRPNGDMRQGGAAMHPFFLERVHLYIINETRPLDENEYIKRFQGALMACMVGGHQAAAHLLCPLENAYIAAPHTDAMFSLNDGAGRKLKNAYAPYIRQTPTANPRRFKRLPVDRKAADLPVNFTLSLSTVKPSRELAFFFNKGLNVTASEKDAQEAHEWDDKLLGFFGMATSTQPVLRRLIFIVTGLVATAVVAILHPVYWWTRQTCTGISHDAGWMVLASNLARFGFEFAQAATVPTQYHWFRVVSSLLLLVPPFLQFYVVCPWVLEETGRGRTIRHRVWTHRERASRRNELSTKAAVSVLVVVSACSWGLRKWPVWVIKPHFVEAQTPVSETLLDRFIDPPIGLMLWILPVTTSILQIYLNHRNRTFAGEYAVMAVLGVVMFVCDNPDYISFFGTTKVAPGISMAKFIDFALCLSLAYQALTLPRVEQDVPDAEDE